MHRDGGSLAVEIGGPSGSATTFFEGIGKHGLSNIAKRNKWLGPWNILSHSIHKNN
jgi:hypothetical protein